MSYLCRFKEYVNVLEGGAYTGLHFSARGELGLGFVCLVSGHVESPGMLELCLGTPRTEESPHRSPTKGESSTQEHRSTVEHDQDWSPNPLTRSSALEP